MKCVFAGVELSGDVPSEEMLENILRINQALSVVPVIGAAGASAESYGNRFAELPVRLIVEKPSTAAALVYIHQLPWLLPEFGPLVLEETLDGGGSWEYSGAAWRAGQLGREQGGAVSIQINFLVKGLA